MEGNKLDCCVVRDLLPAYIEELTEPETLALVRVHLEGCEACRTVEADMRTQVPVEKAPKRPLAFLKRVKRTRLLAAALTAILALWCMWWLYDQEFHYPNTEAGRLAAVEDYIPSPADSTIRHVVEGDPLRVIAWAERGRSLFIFYAADTEDNVHGILCLVRGINGKYRPTNAEIEPFPYTSGVYSTNTWVKSEDVYVPILAGDNCREIYAAEVEYIGYTGAEEYSVKRTYELTESNFLWLMDEEGLEQELVSDGETAVQLHVRDILLFDEDGNDVTGQYRDDTVDRSWSSSKGTAEMGMLYVFMGLTALLGAIFVFYFLRRD